MQEDRDSGRNQSPQYTMSNCVKFLLQSYNSKIKDARAKYFSELITSNQHKTRLLFKTIDHLVNPGSPGIPFISNAVCESFLTFFIDKTDI